MLTIEYHRLLKKANFIDYKSDGGHREAAVLRRYAVSKPSDYGKYNAICGMLRFVLAFNKLRSFKTPLKAKWANTGFGKLAGNKHMN